VSLKDLVKSAGSGARGARFPKIGTIIGGKVVSAEVVQSRDEDGELESWDDGKPKQKVRIIVQTELDEGPDDQGREDDGKRAIYIKWWGAQRKAFIEALTKVDAEDVEPGGDFFAKYAADGEKVKKAWSATKEMKYKYKPPAVVPNDFDDEPEAEAAAPAKAPARKPATRATAKRAAAKPDPEPEDDDLADAAEPLDSKAALAAAGLGEDF
jgi:hypothetical protein